MPPAPSHLPDPRENLWSSLAASLRLLRELKGWSQQQVADECQVDQRTVSAWEIGRNRVALAYCKVLDGHWGTGGVLEAAHRYAATYEGGNAYGDYLADEQTATILRFLTINIVPALFQTPQYARGVFAANGVENIEKELDRLAERQKVLTRTHPPQIHAIIDEAAFLHPPSGGVMNDQYARLLEVAELPNVRVRLVQASADWHLGLDGNFIICSVNNSFRAYVSGQMGAQAVSGILQTDRIVNRFDQLTELALSSAETRRLLSGRRKETA